MEVNLNIRRIESDTWNDFVSLMQTDSQCNACWCLNHREPAGCVTGKQAQFKMQELTAEGTAQGLLAYQGAECIGWIAIDPMVNLIGHDCHLSGKTGEWSIHCLFVKEGFRGKGISVRLIIAAVEYAKANGASLLSAFPIPNENRTKFPLNEAEFSGRFSTYAKLGFKASGKPSEFYQRMELK